LLFNSYIFLLAFLPITMLGFFTLGRISFLFAGLWLVVASFIFYGWWNPVFCILLLISISFNYTVASLLTGGAIPTKYKTFVLVLGIAVNLGALVYYKYLAFIVELANDTQLVQLAIPSITLPLGISFFTFTQIGYLVDCAIGVTEHKRPLNYLLFVTFFPHLIAGPILHNREIIPQFERATTYRINSRNIAVGLAIFAVGLLKKCVLADPLAAVVANAFSSPENLSVLQSWQGATSYSLQLYFDFSGYTDMAIGLARMFNVTFPLNFNSPYKATCVIDYWQRWHMTLTRYLTQYVYSPLALSIMRGRRKRRLPIDRAAQKTAFGFSHMIVFPITVTMTLAGIWHGSGIQFLIFGLLHATFLCVNHAWRTFVDYAQHETPKGTQLAWRWILTYLCVLVGSIFFRAPDVGSALELLRGMIGLHPSSSHDGLGWLRASSLKDLFDASFAFLHICILYFIVWVLPNTQQIFRDFQPALDRTQSPELFTFRWSMNNNWAVITGAALAIGFISIGGTSEFLYFRF
jgi:alginate O-acetyltransferase complex protein AlgI